MTAYTVSGNVREALQAEQSVELSSGDTEAIGIVAANIAAINAVAASIGSLPDLNATVAAVNSALAAAQTAALQSQTAAGQAVSAASGVGADVQLADDWARKLGNPVEGTDVSAKQSALAAGTSASNADGSALAAANSATAASGSAVLADDIVNGASGQDFPPGSGHFTLNTYLDQISDVVGQAPVIDGRFINDAGPAGVDTIPFVFSDFYHTVEVQRASGHDVKLKCVQGLYTGPPPQGSQRSYAWVQVINSGAGSVTVEGPNPAGGGSITTVYPPKRIAYAEGDFKNNTPGATTNISNKLTAIPVPAGTGRAVTIVTISTYWSGTGHTTSITSGQIGSLTKRQSAGDGTIGNADPNLVETFTGTLPDGPGGSAGSPVTDLDVTFIMSPFAARGVILVFVHQDVSAFENPFAIKRTGNALTITRSITPSTAKAVNLLCAGFRHYLSAPVVLTVTPVTTDAEDFTANGTGQPGGTTSDIAYAVLNDGGLLNVAYAYTATAAAAWPAVLGGVTLLPRTVTVVTVGDDGLITDQAKPFTVAPKQQGFVMCADDGTSWYADK